MKLNPVSFDDYAALAPFFAWQPHRLCTYSLPSLISWNTREFKPYAAVTDDFLVAGYEFATRKKERHLILPLSLNGNGTPGPEQLREVAERFGFDRYCCVPEQYIDAQGKDRVEALFHVGRQTFLDDYVYLKEDLAGLKGNRYAKKRNLIKQFTQSYVAEERVKIEPLTSAAVPECIAFLDDWCEERNCDYDEDMDLACERRAAINMLNHVEMLDVRGLVARVDGMVSAFAVGGRLTREMGVLHFEKAFSRIKGLYQYFDNQCARRLFEGFRYINKESDMDIPGLAQAKKSYHPVMMIHSYKLTLR